MSASVSTIHDVAVPLADGTTLSGNLLLPAPLADGGRYPAILTFIPYLKDGWGGRGRLEGIQRHFAARGYAVLQLDFRGIGGSSGVNPYPFHGRERHDGHEAVEWIAAQPWCTGAVGMWGLSYGGITTLAVASTRPPHLRAIAPVHASDDNWESLFVHRGSRLMFWADPHWGPMMTANNLLPPLRGQSEDGLWQRRWRERLDGNTPWHLVWHGPPPWPGYWQEQIIDPGQIETPTFIIGGWHDAYPDDTVRVFNGVRGPRRLLIGPWKHELPDDAMRAPVGAITEIDRWWDRWLKEIDTGVEREPAATIYVQGADHWRHEAEWPPARCVERTFLPGADQALTPEPTAAPAAGYAYDARAGVASLAYDACALGISYPADQSADDHLGQVSTGLPLAEPLELAGSPVVDLYFSTDAPLADINLVAKLCEVQPDGRSFLITHENLNAARASAVGQHDGQPVYLASLPLRGTCYRCAPGHRLRLVISGANFPYIWPTPRCYALSIHRMAPYATRLRLPVAPPAATPLPAPVLPPAVDYRPASQLEGGARYRVVRALTEPTVTVEGERWGRTQVEPGAVLVRQQRFSMTVDADHPDRANARETAVMRLERATSAIEVRVQNVVLLSQIAIEVEIDLDGTPFYRRRWSKDW